MKADYQSTTSIRAWQSTSPRYENLTRKLRAVQALALYLPQLPFIYLDTLVGTTYYGRPSWSFQFRAFRLVLAYFIWAKNPGTRPALDVLTDASREAIGKLKCGQRAELIVVPARPDQIVGDAVHELVQPEVCPCFWQWLDDMPSPATDDRPMHQRRVMMYFVGGGMVQGHPLQSALGWRIMSKTAVPIFGVNFRKCVTKQTAFPAALQDAVAAYFYLLDLGFARENISIMGDSGGGGIATTLLLYLKRHGFPMPDNAVLVSPFVDLVDDFQGDPEPLHLDILNPEMCSMVQYQYTENRPDLRATLLSPSRAELPEGYSYEGFPRTMMVWGEVEIFKRGIEKLVECLRRAGVDVECVVGKDEVHDYPVFTRNFSDDGFFGKIVPFQDAKAATRAKL
ncbi:hypothetical protein BP5796_11199 [Coleophoma crateriformis]|uniref:Alpha/beta hydrolase fold-3 domain-containing protein n=1 Tax=Coleophoma crateriformis TaxID=565419 RepID=A0A3D8QHU4_9HELO|nr:hypothetical protein BP5796_11199 [Coleophoma crateriformis]